MERLSQARQVARVYSYAPGLIEVTAAFVPTPTKEKASRGFSAFREDNIGRASSRAKSSVRRLVMSMRADRMLTLTTRLNITDFAESASQFARFIREIRKVIPGFEYVAVPERQKRGAWHWHLAIRGFIPIRATRAAWLSVCKDGNVDVTEPRALISRQADAGGCLGEGGARISLPGGIDLASVRLASYLSKYLAKSFEDNTIGLNRHRYRASETITVPMVVIRIPALGIGELAQYAKDLIEQCGGTPTAEWKSTDGLIAWAATW